MKAKKLGYAIEYYSNGKFLDLIKVDVPDREKTGYNGKLNHVAKEKIKIGKKTIKAGQAYATILIPLSGRMI